MQRADDRLWYRCVGAVDARPRNIAELVLTGSTSRYCQDLNAPRVAVRVVRLEVTPHPQNGVQGSVSVNIEIPGWRCTRSCARSPCNPDVSKFIDRTGEREQSRAIVPCKHNIGDTAVSPNAGRGRYPGRLRR